MPEVIEPTLPEKSNQHRVGILYRRLRRGLTRPLVLAQATTSLYGLLSTFVAANVLSPHEFLVFTLLTLTQGIGTGVVMAALGEPSLVALRRDKAARARLAQVLCASVPVAALVGVIYVTAAGLALSTALGLGLATVLPILHNWSRVRAIAVQNFVLVLMSDLVRLALVIGVSIYAVAHRGELTASGLQALFLACAAPAVAVPLVSRVVRAPASTRYSTFAPLAKWQLVEFTIAQVQTSIPLLVIAAQATTSIVGGFRLSQTLVGPANLLYVALATNFLAMAATSGHTDAEVIMTGKRTARYITLATFAVVAAAVGVSVLVPGLFPAVDTRDLLIGLACVGILTCTSASAGVHAVVLRSLFLQRTVAFMRAGVTCASWLGFALGYLAGGVSGSMVGGFLFPAVANPVVVNAVAAMCYRRRLRTERPDHLAPA